MQQESYLLLNGTCLPAADAAIPVQDRGFRFGDGVFETIRLTRGVPYQWETHITRLEAGRIALKIPATAHNWADAARSLIAKKSAEEGFLRLTLTRGTGSIGYLPAPDSAPTWMVETLPPRPMPAAACRLWLSSLRRPPLSALPVNHKLLHGIGSSLALLEAKENSADEAIQLSSEGHLCSAAAANIFWLEQEKLYTPSLETGCLAGTTRAAIMRLSPIPIIETRTLPGDLANAEAMFLTNCRVSIWPVRSLAPLQLTFNTAHPVINQLTQLLLADRESDYQVNKIAWKNYP